MIARRSRPPYSAEDIRTLLAAGPQERVVLLPARTAPRTLAEALAALANSGGGVVALGVSSSGAPQKATDAAALADLVLQACLQADPPLILPSPQAADSEPGGPFLLVHVPAGLPNVYSVHGLYLTRSGPHNRSLSTPELRRLLLDRGEGSYETQVLEAATLDDLDSQRIDRYLDRLMLLPAEDGTETLLARGCIARDAASEPRPTVAGMLLFGRMPQQYLRSAEIICVRYAGESMGDEFVRQEIGGTLPDQIRQAEAFVAANMRRDQRIRGLARDESAEYPLEVVREAIVNAVAHRDYSIRGEGIRLLMFGDRLEIYSPGRLPGHVTLANLKDERFSRNEAVVALLSDLGYIERLGYGIDRMYAVLQDAGLPEPTFEETAAGFLVTIRSAAHAPASARAPSVALQAAPLNERQAMALAWVREHGRITNSELQELAPDVSAETIRRDLADLVDKTLLLRIGSKRATYYILK